MHPTRARDEHDPRRHCGKYGKMGTPSETPGVQLRVIASVPLSHHTHRPPVPLSHVTRDSTPVPLSRRAPPSITLRPKGVLP